MINENKKVMEKEGRECISKILRVEIENLRSIRDDIQKNLDEHIIKRKTDINKLNEQLEDLKNKYYSLLNKGDD